MATSDVLKKLLVRLKAVEQLLHDTADASVKLELRRAILELEAALEHGGAWDPKFVWTFLASLLLKLPEIAELIDRFRK